MVRRAARLRATASGDFVDEVIAVDAKDLIREVRDNPMLVVLLPAPEPMHAGHMVRRVISRPPDWYMEHFYHRRGRKTFKRHRFLAALERVAACAPIRGAYQKDIVKFLKERLAGENK
jgi:hypothetical protein